MKTQLLGIIGLQRVGSSVGLAFKQSKLEITVGGHDRDRGVMKQAKEMGAIDKSYTSVANLIADADILVVAEPLSEMEETFQVMGRYVQEHVVIIDFASLKKPVQALADKYLTQGHYVAMMPIAHVDSYADTRLTIDAADGDLYRGSVVCMMPGPKVDEDAVQTAANIGRVLGCEPFFVDMGEYDAYMQALETAPSLIGTALFRSLTRATGWRDMVRFAGMPFAQVTSVMGREADIAHMTFSDKVAALHWIDSIIQDLVEMRRWINDGDLETLGALMTELNIQREQWLHDRRENNWNESMAPKVESPGFMEQMIGGGLFRRRGKDKK